MSYRGGRANEDNVNAAITQAKILRDFISRYVLLFTFKPID